MHPTRRNKFPKATLDRKYGVNGHATTFRDWVNENFFSKRVRLISANQVRQVVDLEPGESIIINSFEIKRIT